MPDWSGPAPPGALEVARRILQPFPQLGSLFAMILAQAVTPLSLPPTPSGEFAVRATSFEEYVTGQISSSK
jgi:hypothetical protein